MSCPCLRCGRVTGRSGLCLCCRGMMERTCYGCRTELPQVYHDYLCLDCGLAQGAEHVARANERKVRGQALRRCDDCNGWMYLDEGPVCPICRWVRGDCDATGAEIQTESE
jgi:hypothetical protein